AAPATRAPPLAAHLPWYVAATLVAATSAKVGIIWDISWHRSIGRDPFWTPAHAAIYLGGVLAGLACGWLVLRMSFAGTAEQRAATVGFWGFRGPLGAWVCIWGAFAMITSAPFDNWWHNAYGLDVKVLSPPHVILALGIWAVQLGALFMVLSLQNRTPERETSRLHGLLAAYLVAILLQNATTVAIDLLLRRAGRNRDWILSVAAGLAFPALFFVVQWFFTEFLLTPHARNFFFGGDQWDYSSRLGPWRYEFWRIASDPVTARGLAIAAALAIVAARLGLWWGNWMQGLRR